MCMCVRACMLLSTIMCVCVCVCGCESKNPNCLELRSFPSLLITHLHSFKSQFIPFERGEIKPLRFLSCTSSPPLPFSFFHSTSQPIESLLSAVDHMNHVKMIVEMCDISRGDTTPYARSISPFLVSSSSASLIIARNSAST
jgi:hypothetical protein